MDYEATAIVQALKVPFPRLNGQSDLQKAKRTERVSVAGASNIVTRVFEAQFVDLRHHQFQRLPTFGCCTPIKRERAAREPHHELIAFFKRPVDGFVDVMRKARRKVRKTRFFLRS